MASNIDNGDPDRSIINISRPVLSEQTLKSRYGYEPENELSIKEKLLKALTPKEKSAAQFTKNFLAEKIPIVRWLPKYQLKKWLLADVISGLTIGIMQIPQGMSYALLAGQHPIHGLYNAFLPVILYTILGTSRHTSMGTFALTSLMLGNAMAGLVPDPDIPSEQTWAEVYDRRIQLATAMMFISGIFLFGLSILKVGSVVIYLSDPMISGFTFGAAILIVVSQFKSLLGVKIGSYAGPLNLIWILRDIFTALANLDDEGRTKTIATVVISAICIIFLVILKELNLRYKEKIPLGLPLPGEMIVVIVGTGISYGVNLAGRYGVSIIGDIPSGLPPPKVPALNELSSLVGYAIPIAIVGYSVSVSVAKIFGNKFGYEIDANQELVAYGVSNTICSFFSCFIAFPSMSRSCVQVESGGKTQVVGLVSSAIVLLVLLVIGPLFSSIPRACLAAIICAAMKGMLKRILDLKSLWKISKLDFASWLVAALGTIFLDAVYGLVVGVGFTLLTIVFRTQFFPREPLRRIGDTEVYRKAGDYLQQGEEEQEIRVAAFRGPMHYVNKESFRNTIRKVSGIDPVVELARRRKAEKKEKKRRELAKESSTDVSEESSHKKGVVNTGFTHTDADGDANGGEIDPSSSISPDVSISLEDSPSSKLRYIIVDCSQMSFMDSVGAKVIRTVADDYQKIDIVMLLTSCSSEIMKMLSVSGYFEKFADNAVFVSVHDAVVYSQDKLMSEQCMSEDNPEDMVAPSM